MSQTAFQNTPAGQSPVGTLLRTTGFVSRLNLIFTALFAGLAIAILTILIAVALDAATGLSPALLLIVDLVVLGLVMIGIVYMVVLWRRNRSEPKRLARLVEQRMEIDDSRLINSLELSVNRPDHCSNELVSAAISKGNDLARDLSPIAAVDFRPMRKWLVVFIVAGLVALSAIWFCPAVLQSVVPRYLQPFAGHPPYTSVVFNVKVEPEQLYEARPATIVVDIGGPHEIEQANLVFLGHEKQSDGVAASMVHLDVNEFAYELTDVPSSVRFYVDTPKGRSRVFQFSALPIPLFENVNVVYEFPEYTNWKTISKPLDHTGIQALTGTKVTIVAMGNMPLSHGEFAMQTGSAAEQQTITMSPLRNNDIAVQSSFEIVNDGTFEIGITSENGGDSEQTITGKLKALPDRPPQIAIVSPEKHVMAVEGWKVPITVQAIDDIGLQRVQLMPAINGWGPYPRDLPLDSTTRNVVQTGYVFDLEELGAKAGDAISYYASATDDYPNGNQVTSTDTYVIQVISLAEYQEIARQEYRMEDVLAELEEFQNQLDELAEQKNEILEQIEQLEQLDELTEEQQQQLDELAEQLNEFNESAEQLAEEMRERADKLPLYDFDEAYQQMLEQMAEQLENQADLSEQLNESIEQMQKQGLSSVQSMLEAAENFKQAQQPFGAQSQQEMSELNQDMQQLQQGEELVSEVNRLQQLIRDQRDLADRLGEFRNEENPSDEQENRLRQMAKQQDLLQQELDQIMEDIESAAEQAREHFPQAAESAQEIVDAIRDMEVTEDQGQAAQAGREPTPPDAFHFAESAAKKLESLQCESCNGNAVGQQMQQGDGPLKLTKGQLNNSMQQLLQSMNGPPSMMPGQGKQGQQGGGFRGSMSRSGLFGPQLPGESNRQQSRRGGRDRNQRGVASQEDQLQYDMQAEVLNPDSTGSMQLLQQYMRGVPSAYRDQARAYLKRLAEEDR